MAVILVQKKTIFYALIFTASILNSIIALLDVLSSARILDPITLTVYIFWAGLIVQTIGIIILYLPTKRGKLGKLIDPAFEGLYIPRKKGLVYIILASLASVLNTVFYFQVASIGDPSTLLPLSQFTTVYLLVIDAILQKDKPTIIETSSVIIITIGAFLAAITTEKMDLITALLALGPMNIMSTIYIYLLKRISSTVEDNRKIDSISLRYWLIFYMTLQITPFYLISCPYEITQILHEFVSSFLILSVDMGLTFLAMIMYIRALSMGKMSIVNALVSLSAIFGIGVSFIGSWLFPNYVQIPVYNFFVIITKTFGAILVVLGVFLLLLSETSTYILLKIDQKRAKELLEELSKVNGIETVSAVVGEFDIIAKLNIRSLAKAYEILIKRLARLKGIEEIFIVSILKEWEKI